ncbi:hypothetical protein BOTBODRAFT_31192 [Botryobasidium botryosum FD-172 SS1]|uniref:Uncharacterized protein n=1 Tax=Botryobasidium botryosum (strain FD-172 SS1) TaxID=930990 RepID=A0A067MKN8_BOTB1|nr:hypothetical protein BOTBODRAFT_31192 [Botryobasidium botryosum FD-172 SS1]
MWLQALGHNYGWCTIRSESCIARNAHLTGVLAAAFLGVSKWRSATAQALIRSRTIILHVDVTVNADIKKKAGTRKP